MSENFSLGKTVNEDILSSHDLGSNANGLGGANHFGKNSLRPYYNPETFNAKYEVRYIPKEGIIDNNGLPLVSKLKSITSLAQQQQSSVLSSSNENWWFKFKHDHSDGTLNNVYRNSSAANNFRGIGNDYYGQTVFSSFKDYLDVNKWSQFIKVFAYKFGKIYLKHLLVQPFVVSKTFLQVHDFSNKADNEDGIEFHVSLAPKSIPINRQEGENDKIAFKQNKHVSVPATADSDEIEFFVDDIKEDSAEVFVKGGTTYHKVYKIRPTDSSTSKVIESVYDIEGTFGVVRSNNTTFIYNFLSGTLEAWLNGFISPFLNIPDPNFVEVSLSNNLVASVLLVISSTLITGLILLPLELINMKFMVTKMRHIHFKRSIREHIKSFNAKSFFIDLFTKPKNIKLLILQALNRLNNALYHKLLLQTILLNRFFEIDKFTSLKRYETGNFLIKFLQLIVKVPLDNLYKREQLNFLLDPSRLRKNSGLSISNQKDLIIVPYKDVSIKNYFTNLYSFKSLWKGYNLELIGVGCGYLVSLLDTERTVIGEERF